MSRLKNFSRNLAASYLQLAVNVVYSLVSVPLILHWLPKAEFGLWALLVQLMSYIGLVDLGINSAIARFLVDHKDRREGGGYGSLVKTSALVSVVQGLMVLAVVTLGAPLLAAVANIPAEYRATFVALLRFQGVIAAFMFCMNPLGIILYAHQRMDLTIWQGMVNLLASLGLLVLFLFKGCGIFSFVYANALTALAAPVYLFWNCRRLGFWPRAGEWGKISWAQFKEVFLYGKDVFLMNVGIQLIAGSQTIIVSRALGLEAAAAWAVGSKIFMLLRQIMFQPINAASAGLCEMLARNEKDRLQNRFRHLVVLTASLGAAGGTAFALCNHLFVQIWTNGKIIWQPESDVLLGLWIFVASLQTTHTSFVFVTREIGKMPYLFIAEGCAFVTLSLWVGYRGGIPGIIACSVICLALFSCQFGMRKSARYFQIPLATLALGWIGPSLRLALALCPAALALWFLTVNWPVIWRLTAHVVVAGIGGGVLFLRLGVPAEVVQEITVRLPRPAARLMRMLAARAV